MVVGLPQAELWIAAVIRTKTILSTVGEIHPHSKSPGSFTLFRECEVHSGFPQGNFRFPAKFLKELLELHQLKSESEVGGQSHSSQDGCDYLAVPKFSYLHKS